MMWSRYTHNPDQRLSVAEVEQLPQGSIVTAVGQAWVTVPGGLAPVSMLPERSGGYIPDGEPVENFGPEFVLIAKGSGKVPTHGTAQRKLL